MSTCPPPMAGAGIEAVQVVEPPGSKELTGQLIVVASESVTTIGDNRTSPVLVTRKVTAMGEPAATDTPGAASASSPLIALTIVTAGCAGVHVVAGSLSSTGDMGAPVAGSMICLLYTSRCV